MLRTAQCCLFVSATCTHVPPGLSATSLFELDPVFDIDRALSVIDCDDRYYNFMGFAVVTPAVASGAGQTKNITIVRMWV